MFINCEKDSESLTFSSLILVTIAAPLERAVGLVTMPVDVLLLHSEEFSPWSCPLVREQRKWLAHYNQCTYIHIYTKQVCIVTGRTHAEAHNVLKL